MPNTSRAQKKNKAFAQLRKEGSKKPQEKKVEVEPIIDADTFESEADKFHSTKIKNLRQKAGLLEKDKDLAIIQPLITDKFSHHDDDDEEDEQDHSNIDRAVVKRNVEKATKKAKDESDDEEEDDDETLHTNNAHSSSDEEELRGAYSDDEESDEEINKLKKTVASSSTNKSNRWKRDEFFEGQSQVSQKTHTSRERRQYEDEEEEVKRIQETRSKRLAATDYLDDFMLDSSSKTTSKKKKPSQTSSSSTTQVSLEEKLAVIQKDAPEFMELLVDLKNKLSTVRDQLHPLISKVKMGNLMTTDGISYLETKYHLVLNYCTNILFYMLLKSSGKSVKDHPVLEQLVELRLLLEKIKPIDERMKYQIDKLVKLANNVQDTTMTYEFKANPDRLLKGDEEGFDMEDGEEDGEMEDDMGSDDEGVVKSSRKLKTSLMEDSDESEEDEEETYKAPKMMAVRYDEGDQRKAEKTKKKAMERIEKGKFLKELKAEFGDAPEEIESLGTEGRSKYLAQIEEQELESRNRMLLTKKDKKKIAAELKIKDPLTEMDSFHEFTALERYAKSKSATNNKLALAQYIGDADEALKQIEKRNNGTEDEMNEEEKAMLASGALTMDSDSDFDEDEDDYDEEEEDSKKRKRKDVDMSNKKKKRDYEDQRLDRKDFRDDQGKRKADNNIIKNRGLAAHKKQDQRNPRLRLKNKYANKTGGYRFGKVKSQAGYSGENRIQSNTVKSRKIKS